jgi:hypothetical protein
MLEIMLSPPVLITAGVAALAIVAVVALRKAIALAVVVAALAVLAIAALMRWGVLEQTIVDTARENVRQRIQNVFGAHNTDRGDGEE